MTSRGCTSRSTNGVAQVRRPSCTVVFRTLAFVHSACVPSMVEVTRPDRCSPSGCKDQLAALPRRPCYFPGAGFLHLPQPQRGGTDIRQWQRRIGGGGFGLPVQQLPRLTRCSW
jgi:hypothetical protein